jgi:hypothetical protein
MAYIFVIIDLHPNFNQRAILFKINMALCVENNTSV